MLLSGCYYKCNYTHEAGFRNDVERVAFFFELYLKYESLLPARAMPAAKRKSGKKHPA